jgi:flagellar hook-associated protein 1 FlgK
MGMSAALSISATQIDNINNQLALISHNIANAATPDYAAESIDQTTVTADGVGMGALDGPVQRSIDTQTQADLFAQNGTASSLSTQQTALQQIDAAQGAVGSGTDIGSLLGAMQDAFSTLAGAPDNQTQQQATVAAAQALATQINQVGNAIGTQRQTAQNAIVSGVAQLNTTLNTLGSLSDRIVAARAIGQSTADLENQRDAAEDTLSQLVGVRFLDQPNGDLLVMTQSGTSLPIHTITQPFATSPATLGAGVYAPGGGVPAITFGGQDVTSQLTGGTLGANIRLRDHTLPTLQANLDEFSYTLASRFQAQGLTLFTDAAGNVPSGGGTPAQSTYLGFSNEIQVNPAVTANASLVRDGTDAIAGSPTGASAFTPNPAGGPVGFSTLISRVLTYALGSQAQAGVAQTAPNVNGLGASGTLSAGFAAPTDLTGLATAVTGAEAAASAGVTSQLTTAQGLQTTLKSQLSSGSAVNMDAQMSQMIVLQNAYAANARVLSAVQAMWTQLTQAVQL